MIPSDDAVGDVHPIPDSPDWSLEQRVRHLECYLGRLWDQVWWLSLPEERRKAYIDAGFESPITNFYRPL